MFGFFSKKKEDITIIMDVVGESFNNEDGSSRQAIIAQYVQQGDPATIEFYWYKGELACKVLIDEGQIGHLPKNEVKDIRDRMTDGSTTLVSINSVGASGDSGLYGVTLNIDISY